MSGVKVGGVWKTPAVTSVKVGGVWRTAATISTKVGGQWKITTFAGPPAAPQLSYTDQGQFTIGNYDPSLTYVVSGASRTNDLLTSVTNGATITVAYSSNAPVSAASTMNVLAGARILYGAAWSDSSTGCGPRSNLSCPGGMILDPSGATSGGAPGSLIQDPAQGAAFCGGACDDYCWQLSISCYNWYWTNYTANGYTLFGGDSGTWGKATNG